MQVTASSFTVAEYCEQMRAKGIVVNHDYQRSDKVWPAAARSYLIETILLGYPMPKMSLYQITNLKTKRTKKEIVDGQQRSTAVSDFLEDKLRLTGKSPFAGKVFSQLDQDQQQRFVDYNLTVDVFVGATPEEIRQVFRRMNSYTIPLNPQEKRHATHQGEFKWFIVDMTERYADALKQLGVFTERQLSRMADATLLSDIVYTLSVGIRSASEATLDKYYQDNDASFSAVSEMSDRLEAAMNIILEWKEIHQSSLMKMYNFYSLVLAISHALRPDSVLNTDFPRNKPLKIDRNLALPNLTALSEALEEPSTYPQFSEYVNACSKATNRIEPRRARFRWLSRALDPNLLA
jgi:Protein of unknown function DUF262